MEKEDKGLHRHVFWFYGILVALAIRDALLSVIPHIIAPTPDVETWAVYEEVFRLALFLLVIIRFYFGSVVFFGDVYINSDTAPKYVRKNYGLDSYCCRPSEE